MTDVKQENYKNLRAQAIIFYPFKYKKNLFSNTEKEIQIDPISIEQSRNIIYGDFIRYYDTQYNIENDNNYSKNDKEYSRSVYTVSLDKNNMFMNEAVHKPEYKKGNAEKKAFKKFVEMFEKKVEEKRENTFKRKNVNKNIKKLVEEFPAHLSHANLVLYNKTKIGFLELYINYEYTKPISNNEKLKDISKILSNDVGNLKKIFFSKDNTFSIEERVDEAKRKRLYNDVDLEILRNFINNLDIKENIEVSNEDIMFFNKDFKRRAYAQTNVYLNETLYKMLSKKIEDRNEFMMYIGRTHDFNGRKLENVSFDKFIIQNENDNVFGVTNSSFGILSKYTDRANFNYSMQHLSEQFMFFCEMSLHLRYYLYTMIEVYRKSAGNYRKTKVEFTKNITRYKMSLISEVEPQRVYEKLLEELRIEKLYEDANKALDSLQAIEEKNNSQAVTILSVLFAIFGIFGIANNLNEWLKILFNGEQAQLIQAVTLWSPIAMLLIVFVFLIIRKVQK